METKSHRGELQYLESKKYNVLLIKSYFVPDLSIISVIGFKKNCMGGFSLENHRPVRMTFFGLFCVIVVC